MTDIIRKRGDTYADRFLLTNAETEEPVDLSGCSLLLTVDPERAPVDDTNNLYQLSGTIVDTAGGIVEFAPDETQADQLGTYYYDIQLTDSAGRKRTIAAGRYKYVQDITKD